MEKFDINKTRAIKGKEIALTIKQQIVGLTDMFVRMSWGADGWTNYDDKALRFRTRGHHHKGYVYIVLNGSDLYDIHFVSLQGNVKKVIEDVYAEDLPEILDTAIERIADYVR